MSYYFSTHKYKINLVNLTISCKKTLGIGLSVLITNKLFRISETLISNARAAEDPVGGISNKLLSDNVTQPIQSICTDELSKFDYRRSLTSGDSPYQFHVYLSTYAFEDVQMVTLEMFQTVFKLNFL